MWRSFLSWLRRKISKRGLNADRNALKNQKKSCLLATIPSTPLRRTQRKSITPIRSRALIMIKKAIKPATTPSQKTSINLGNFCAND